MDIFAQIEELRREIQGLASMKEILQAHRQLDILLGQIAAKAAGEP